MQNRFGFSKSKLRAPTEIRKAPNPPVSAKDNTKKYAVITASSLEDQKQYANEIARIHQTYNEQIMELTQNLDSAIQDKENMVSSLCGIVTKTLSKIDDDYMVLVRDSLDKSDDLLQRFENMDAKCGSLAFKISRIQAEQQNYSQIEFKLNELETKNQELAEQNQELTKLLEEAQKTIESQSLESKDSQYSTNEDILTIKLKSLENENLQLTKKIEDMGKEKKKMISELVDISKQVDFFSGTLKEKEDIINSKDEEITELMKQIEERDEIMNSIDITQINGSQTDEINQYKRTIDDLKVKINALTLEKESFREINNDQETIQRLQQQLNLSQQEIEKLKYRIPDSKMSTQHGDTIKSLMNQIEDKDQQIDDYKAQLDQKEKEIESLEEQLDIIASLENQIDDLKKKTKNMDIMKNTIKNLQETIQNKDEELRKTEEKKDSEVQLMIKNYEDKQKQYEAQITELESQIDDVNNDYIEKDHSLSEFRTKYDTMKNMNKELTNKILTLELEQESLHDELDNYEKIKEEKEKLINHIQELKARINENIEVEFNNLQNQNNSLRQMNESLQEKLSQTVNQIQNVSVLEERLKSAESMCEMFKELNEINEKKVEEANKHNKELYSELQKERTPKKPPLTSISCSPFKTLDHVEASESNSDYISQLEEEGKNLKIHINTLNQQIQILQETLNDANSHIDSLKAGIMARDYEIAGYAEQIKTNSLDMEKNSSKIKQLQDSVQEINGKYLDEKQKHTSTMLVLNEAKSQLKQVQNEFENQSQHHNRLVNQMKRMLNCDEESAIVNSLFAALHKETSDNGILFISQKFRVNMQSHMSSLTDFCNRLTTKCLLINNSVSKCKRMITQKKIAPTTPPKYSSSIARNPFASERKVIERYPLVEINGENRTFVGPPPKMSLRFSPRHIDHDTSFTSRSPLYKNKL